MIAGVRVAGGLVLAARALLVALLSQPMPDPQATEDATCRLVAAPDKLAGMAMAMRPAV